MLAGLRRVLFGDGIDSSLGYGCRQLFQDTSLGRNLPGLRLAVGSREARELLLTKAQR